MISEELDRIALESRKGHFVHMPDPDEEEEKEDLRAELERRFDELFGSNQDE